MSVGELILGYYETCIGRRRAARRGRRAADDRARRCTGSSARARARTGRACRSPRRAATTGCASWWGRWPRCRSRSPTLCGGLGGARIAAATPSGCSRSPTRAARRSTGGGSSAVEVRRARGGAVIGLDPRVTGAQRYARDVERPGMLHAAFVRSPYPHARVTRRSRRPTAASSLTRTTSAAGLYGCQVKDQRVLADVARYAGDIVAAVAAPDPRGGARAGRRGRGRVGGAAGGVRRRRGGREGRAAAAPSARPTSARRGGLDRRAADRRHQRLPPLPDPPRRRGRGAARGRRGGRGGVPHARAPRTRRWSRT